jgi:hypothetical protein
VGLPARKLTAGSRNLCNEEFHNFYPPPDIISVIKRRMRWVRHGTDEKCEP